MTETKELCYSCKHCQRITKEKRIRCRYNYFVYDSPMIYCKKYVSTTKERDDLIEKYFDYDGKTMTFRLKK